MGAEMIHWRKRLLGSLQGQLQLATYLAVFLGFTGASCAGLWLSDRNFNREKKVALMSSAESIETRLMDHNSTTGLANSPSQLSQSKRDKVKTLLDLNSSKKSSLWVELPDGSLLLPSQQHSVPAQVIEAALKANPSREQGSFHQFKFSDRNYLSQLHTLFPSGHRLWVAAEIDNSSQILTNYLAWMILIWGACLVCTLVAVSWLVKRIVRPLRQLTEMTENITAETLMSSSINIKNAPFEVAQLALTYEDLLERLSQSWTQQRQFVSAVSHELRTPLTIVQGYLHRTLRRSTNLTEAQIKGLTTAEQESVRVKTLLDDLLDLARGDAGRLSFTNKPLLLSEELKQVVELASSNLKRELKLHLPIDRGEHDKLSLADPGRLKQVLLDLIENADKYSPPQLPIVIRLSQQGDMMQITVQDQGIGIPTAELDKIFKRFYRASNSPSDGGSGLGLSVVKLLVEGMGGTISVNSQLSQGSCFTVSFPILNTSTT